MSRVVTTKPYLKPLVGATKTPQVRISAVEQYLQERADDGVIQEPSARNDGTGQGYLTNEQ